MIPFLMVGTSQPKLPFSEVVVKGKAQRDKYHLVAFDGSDNNIRSHLRIRCRSHLSREGVPIVEDNLERNIQVGSTGNTNTRVNKLKEYPVMYPQAVLVCSVSLPR